MHNGVRRAHYGIRLVFPPSERQRGVWRKQTRADNIILFLGDTARFYKNLLGLCG